MHAIEVIRRPRKFVINFHPLVNEAATLQCTAVAWEMGTACSALVHYVVAIDCLHHQNIRHLLYTRGWMEVLSLVFCDSFSYSFFQTST